MANTTIPIKEVEIRAGELYVKIRDDSSSHVTLTNAALSCMKDTQKIFSEDTKIG